uniref:Transmembrane protein n=1 Tax=Glycine max TaxID=3847 RepID=C6SWR0_SOYBN|nr:unknown [Glycine max]
MESSMRLGYLMTVFAMSGSIVLLFYQVNKHLCNNFVKKFEFEIRGSMKHQTKKRVQFAKDVMEIPMEEKSDRINVARTQQVIDKVLFIDDVMKSKHEQKLKDAMPPNRAILYRGIMNDRKGRLGF